MLAAGKLPLKSVQLIQTVSHHLRLQNINDLAKAHSHNYLWVDLFPHRLP